MLCHARNVEPSPLQERAAAPALRYWRSSFGAPPLPPSPAATPTAAVGRRRLRYFVNTMGLVMTQR
jgi:hypothetical protein